MRNPKKTVGQLPFQESKAFALLSTFFPEYSGQPTDTFISSVKEADPLEIIARAESLNAHDVAANQRDIFEKVLGIAKRHATMLASPGYENRTQSEVR